MAWRLLSKHMQVMRLLSDMNFVFKLERVISTPSKNLDEVAHCKVLANVVEFMWFLEKQFLEKSRPVSDSVAALLDEEQKKKLYDYPTYKEFCSRNLEKKFKIWSFLGKVGTRFGRPLG